MKKPSVLVANRGEIAVRVMRTCKRLSIDTVAVYTDVDAMSPHVKEATYAVNLGANTRAYVDAEALLQVAIEHKVSAVHPGYGFLSENEDFCKAIENASIAWLGPTADTMNDFSLKHVAKGISVAAGVPTLQGSGLLTNIEEAVQAGNSIGYPVLLKATGGGGGRGIYICRTKADIETQFETSRKQGQAFFGNSGVFVEKYIEKAHHIEVQIFGDGKGKVVHFGERECSIQRRHQKVLEETPSPLISDDEELRKALTQAAVALGQASSYRSAGTVEFLVDGITREFYFLEMNTRLQVEHGITEYVNGGIDIVECMLKLQIPDIGQLDWGELESINRRGHSIEVRINGEDPAKDFKPSPGILDEVKFPSGDGIRVDTWISRGTEVSPFYDSLLGKLMVYASTRAQALDMMKHALSKTALKGMPNNLEFLKQLLESPRLIAGDTATDFLETFKFQPRTFEILTSGAQTSVQDWPGRLGYWHVGVPPSGPMDSLAFRLSNALVGNESNAAGLEFSLIGPSILFHCDTMIALTGAPFQATLDGKSLNWWSSHRVKAGQTLKLGAVEKNSGARGYLALAGGIDAALYLGSRATFPSGGFGGYQGRYLRPGDSLMIEPPLSNSKPTVLFDEWKEFAGVLMPNQEKTIGVLPGPYAAPDYFTEDAIRVFYSSPYKVHYNSSRLGVRLIGPRPTWARTDGGEGGSHPSNIHDCVYPIGAINFTGDMPVILTQDGPSLGGFVCPATIASSELWKIGQVSANDEIYFKQITLEQAYVGCLRTDALMDTVKLVARQQLSPEDAILKLQNLSITSPPTLATNALLHKTPASKDHPGAEYRLAGDRYIQIEYGPMQLDLNLRVRVHFLEEWLKGKNLPGIVEIDPAVRSCIIEYDQRILTLKSLFDILLEGDSTLEHVTDALLPSRIVRLPMAFDDRWTHEALEKYSKSIRDDAPYLPSNIEYIAANNGVKGGKQKVEKSIFETNYLVLGLGDVYLGAPCAVPVDPRHRLVTSKMNPARTFTHEGTVGIGGCYMCIYPMNSPGGYQLIGRTLPIWNTFGKEEPFSPEKPWLLEFFDQVQFFRVSEDDLMDLRGKFKAGQYSIAIEDTKFAMKEYNDFVRSIQPEIANFNLTQKEAMAKQLQEEEKSLQRLQSKLDEAQSMGPVVGDHDDDSAYDGPNFVKVEAAFTSNIWDVKVVKGQRVSKDETLLVLEAMKMETPIPAPASGVIKIVKAQLSQLALAGSLLMVIEVAA